MQKAEYFVVDGDERREAVKEIQSEQHCDGNPVADTELTSGTMSANHEAAQTCVEIPGNSERGKNGANSSPDTKTL